MQHQAIQMTPELVDQVLELSSVVMTAMGIPRVVPASTFDLVDRTVLQALGHMHGVYSFPTVELAEWLQEFIGSDIESNAIEIGAGNGALAKYLGIAAYDNRMQEDREIKALYAAAGQPTVTYGNDVLRCDGNSVNRRELPRVVIAQWVTHQYNPARAELGGNMYGVHEPDLFTDNPCLEYYIHIGNSFVHQHKELILGTPHQTIRAPFLISRASRGVNQIQIWKRPE